MKLLFISFGGALGGICRYLIGLLIMKCFPNRPFPIAMLLVNVLGSFGLGSFFGLQYGRIPIGALEDPIYLMIAIGFFGAFTTFSTFSVEAIQLYKEKAWLKLNVYIVLTIFGSIFGFLIGLIITSS
ncbi:fluoride efflux transporter CrcB [Bacillus sp. JCM 19034]|uniref:fluoride efflux transporter CrcB n=1 Tax=Bacillus sp. JCM 19034 TaxID=1481928 RepID=UPI000783C538|nr:fluoride efflux transporter CrcB [Bacillus sp. JCM 19034]